MNTYEYQAINTDGETLTGFIDADSLKQAQDRLRNEGLFPIAIDSCTKDEKTKRKSKREPLIKRRIRLLDIALATRQLATLIAAGLPLAECLNSVLEQTEKKNLKVILAGVRSKVIEGYSLADSLKQYPEAFNHLYCSTIAAGEQTGRLDLIMEQLADYIEKQVAMRNKILQALIYPFVMLFMSFAIVIFLLSYVVPKIIDVFTSSGQILPGITQALLAFTHFTSDYGLYVGLALACLFLLGLHLMKFEKWQYRRDHFLLSIPLIGYTLKHINTARYAKTFGMLLHAGTPVNQAMTISASLVKNRLMHDALTAATFKVQEGVNIYQALQDTKYFPSMTLHLIANGENTGKLESMLERAATNQEQDVSRLIDTLLTLFEPFIIIFMGSIVLFIVLAILLPIFEMNQLVG